MAHDYSTIQKCRELRRKGHTLNQIMKLVGLPKATVFDHIYDIPLSIERRREIREENLKRLLHFNKLKEGKCWPGREIVFLEYWSKDLLFLTAHFMFDGELNYGSCMYHNRNYCLVNKVAVLMRRIFKIEPRRYFDKNSKVYTVGYFHVPLAGYFAEKALWLKIYIKHAPLEEKRLFLRIFFDDEGTASFSIKRNERRVKGSQHDLEILKLIQELLKNFDIDGRIDEKYKEIVIGRKENLIKFRNEINFSRGVYINPERKNSIWKQKLEKREILNKMINSYQK